MSADRSGQATTLRAPGAGEHLPRVLTGVDIVGDAMVDPPTSAGGARAHVTVHLRRGNISATLLDANEVSVCRCTCSNAKGGNVVCCATLCHGEGGHVFLRHGNAEGQPPSAWPKTSVKSKELPQVGEQTATWR